MSCYDIFNGDADGICALQQLRLAEPRDSELVTGVKRDIALLQRVNAQSGDRITVLDISLDKNRQGLEAALEAGADVEYFDHHFAGEIPQHQNLQAHIDTSPEVCTSALVNKHLEGKFALWGAAGAFGDNLAALARDIAASFNLSDEQWSVLQQLGECINYNAYGTSLEDLHFTPEALFRLIQPFANPFDFVEQCPDQFKKLTDGYRDDMALAQRLRAEQQDDLHAVYIMPDEAWARRVSGVYANDLASASPQRAHAILTKRPAGGYVVSVRAPLANKEGADELCRRFPTGGGRKAAAGINNLPDDMVLDFFRQFKLAYSKK